MKPSLALRVGNVLGYVFLIVVNTLASRGMLGPTNDKLSKKNHTYITPAGWALQIVNLLKNPDSKLKATYF